MLRSRKSKISLDTVRNLDTFPKLPDTFVETSRVGATFSVLTYGLILWLLWSEVSYYFDSRFVFKFTPDTDFEAKLKINIDLTVAMPCENVGADILDSTSQNVFMFGSLEEEETWFELSEEQKRYFNNMRYVNSYLREEYHAIQELLWKSGGTHVYGQLPKRKYKPDSPPDACRIHGNLILNKVAGNFHVTLGKSLALPQGHIHISSPFMNSNFTHRINAFSFGDPSPGIVHPLEGDERITTNDMVLYQYFVEVVPTDVRSFLRHSNTYQYAVKENMRIVNHHKGSHGIPGIFFKYDTSALKVLVTEEREPIDKFFVRLCSTVGGIFVIASVINSFVQFIIRKTTTVIPSQAKIYQDITAKNNSDISEQKVPLENQQSVPVHSHS